MLAAAAKYLAYLGRAVALVLAFIAAKLASFALDIYHIDHQVSMVVVLGLILGGVLASLISLATKKCVNVNESFNASPRMHWQCPTGIYQCLLVGTKQYDVMRRVT